MAPPSFFKVLIDASAPHLPLPPDFVTRHLKDKFPENPTLRSTTGGCSWRLEIKKIGGSYCFAHGWNNVVEDAQLRFGDFLVFWLINESTFKVSIFGPNGCEKDLPSKINVEEDDDDGGGVDDGGSDDDDVDVDVDEPYFQTIITKTHKNVLRLPAKFVRLTGIDAKSSIIMKDPSEMEWRMCLRSEKSMGTSRYYFGAEWRDFWRGNELSEGDICLFKFIVGEGKLYLAKVTKKRAVARKGEFPATEAVKRKRGRSPEGHPDFKSEDDPVHEAHAVKRKRGRPPLQKSCVIYF